MTQRDQPLLIVCLGNLLLGDEGFGVHVARALQAEHSSLPEHVHVLEAGTALFEVLPQMSSYGYAILVDAIRAGGTPGTIYRADGIEKIVGQIESVAPVSLHELDLSQTLEMARVLGLLPNRISLIGAEPGPMDLTMELSPALRRAAEKIVFLIFEETKRAAPGEGPGPLTWLSSGTPARGDVLHTTTRVPRGSTTQACRRSRGDNS